jgi:hypothetical protein
MLRITAPERLGSKQGGTLPLDRREQAAQGGLPQSGLDTRLAMDPGRRAQPLRKPSKPNCSPTKPL